MPKNVEIKARAADWRGQLRVARSLCGPEQVLLQRDSFFPCPGGRLKLRVQPDRSYLNFYRRADAAGPKGSRYETSEVSDPESMERLLLLALGRGPAIRKKRRLFLGGQTRIHFDEVRGLGRFIELEVCLRPRQSIKDGRRIALEWMARLGIRERDLLTGAYADMRRRRLR